MNRIHAILAAGVFLGVGVYGLLCPYCIQKNLIALRAAPRLPRLQNRLLSRFIESPYYIASLRVGATAALVSGLFLAYMAVASP